MTLPRPKNPDHLLPRTDSGERIHLLDGTCWCQPTPTTHRGRSTLVHHTEAPKWPDPEPGRVIHTPPRRTRWMRPWGKSRYNRWIRFGGEK